MTYKLISPPDNHCTAIEQILHNRGIINVAEYLNPPETAIHDPLGLDRIENAAYTLIKEILQDGHIHIQVDSDCDGYTSSAILLNYLHRIFPSKVENNFTYSLHDSKYHGIDIGAIPKGTTMIVVPDASSNEIEVHKELAENFGIKIIVLDHHYAEIDYTEEPAIIVNNQICDYPNKALSGAGIVYKFCKVLDKICHVELADDFMDLAALGMVADMMDLRDLETHKLISDGFNNVRNMFFKSMIQKQEFQMKGRVTPFTTGWYIAPYINAMCRSGSIHEKNVLFESMLDYRADKLVPSTKRGAKGQEERLVDQAMRTCTNVKNHQDDNKKSALAMIRPLITDDPVVIIQLENPVDTNLTGLLANQIMHEIQRPVMILNKCYEEASEQVFWSGSARGMLTQDVDDWRAFVDNTGMARYAEGHAYAFGVSFTEDGLADFKELTRTKFEHSKFEPYFDVDYIWRLYDEFDPIILDIGSYNELWGQHVQEPYVAIEHVKITRENLVLMGRGTLKIVLPDHKTTCIKFGAEDLYNSLMEKLPNESSIIDANLVGRCTINEWNGNVLPQIHLEEVEINGIRDWDF